MGELISVDGLVSPELEQKIDSCFDKTRRVYLDTRGRTYTCTVGAKEDEDGSFHLTYYNGRGAFQMLSHFRVPRQFVSQESGEILGHVIFIEPAFAGMSYYGVEVTTCEALACLQVSLNSADSGLRLRPRYFRLTRAEILARLNDLAHRCEQTAPGPGGMARGLALMDANRLRQAAELISKNTNVAPAEVLHPSAFSGYHVKEAINRIVERKVPQ